MNVVSTERYMLAFGLGIASGMAIGTSYYKTGCVTGVAAVILVAYDYMVTRKSSAAKRQRKERVRVTVNKLTAMLVRAPPAPLKDVRRHQHLFATPDYWLFLTMFDGAEGLISKSHAIELWPFKKVQSENTEWKNRCIVKPLQTYGLCFFGTDKQDIKYAFRLENWQAVVVAVSKDGSLIKIADSFIGFLEYLHQQR